MSYDALFSPIKLRGLELKNRVVLPGMNTKMAKNKHDVAEDLTGYHGAIAAGGCGLNIVEIATICPECHAYLYLGLYNEHHRDELKKIVDAIHENGGKAAVQIWHGGFVPQEFFDKTNKLETPDNLTVERIHEIIKQYGQAAKFAVEAGFDALEFHGAHTYLPHEFMNPSLNQRTDEYGNQSLENRCRFACQVLDAVRAAVGPMFPIEFRFSGSELFEGGYDLEEGVRIAQTLESRIDLLHVSAGTYQRGFGDTHPSMFKDHGCNVYLAAEIKKHVSIPVATIGGLNDPAQMEEIIASGKADVVYMARALLADPFLPRKVMENRSEDIVHCLRCFTCMAERAATGTRRCTVNPLIGREMEGDEVQPALVKKKVLIAGGGPGGLYAAWTAARRGHSVVLCEKEVALGGILKSEIALPFKREMFALTETYERFARNAGVEIRFNTEVTPEYVEKEAPDALIIAAGSRPLVPPIKGMDGEQVVVVNELYRNLDKISDKVVVMGGGLAGCECAISLGMEGKEVQLVEMRDALAPDANVRHRPLLLKEIEKQVKAVHTGYRAEEITPEGVWCTDANGERHLVEGTTVICALGQRARTDVVEQLRNTAPFVRVIGDARRVSTITNAVYQGYHAALDI